MTTKKAIRRTASQPATPATPATLLQMAVEQGADIDKLGKLMELQERWQAAQAKIAYTRAITAFKTDPPRLPKNRHVAFGNTEYDHTTLDVMTDILGKALSEHGLSFTWETTQSDSQITVTCILTHVDGWSEKTSLSAAPDTSGGKNSIQAVGSTTTYLQRYTLRAITGTAEAGQDDDGKAAEPKPRITDEQVLEIEAKIQENEIDMERFLAWLNRATKAESIADITQAAYPNVMRQITTIIKNQSK